VCFWNHRPCVAFNPWWQCSSSPPLPPSLRSCAGSSHWSKDGYGRRDAKICTKATVAVFIQCRCGGWPHARNLAYPELNKRDCTEGWLSCVLGDLGELHIEQMNSIKGGSDWLRQVASHHVGHPRSTSQCFLHVFMGRRELL